MFIKTIRNVADCPGVQIGLGYPFNDNAFLRALTKRCQHSDTRLHNRIQTRRHGVCKQLIYGEWKGDVGIEHFLVLFPIRFGRRDFKLRLPKIMRTW